MAMTVTISTTLCDRLLAGAAATPDHEVCGLLFGTPARIDDAVTCANVAADTRTAFEIDPGALFGAHRAARAGGPAIIGCFHSHPGGNARPSARDAAAAAGDGSLWLIIGGGEMGLWRTVSPGGFENVALAIGR